MHSSDDFRVSGLEVGDAFKCYLVSDLEVKIALILCAHQSTSCGCALLSMHSSYDFRVSGLEVRDAFNCYLVSGLEVRIALILCPHQKRK